MSSTNVFKLCQKVITKSNNIQSTSIKLIQLLANEIVLIDHSASNNSNEMEKEYLFPLVFDPIVQQKALIIGMFVLRPSIVPWNSPLPMCSEKNENDALLHEMQHIDSLAFNYTGLDGGWLIADQNKLDAFRLAFQYGISDAVIIGSNTVSTEGLNKLDPNDSNTVLSQGYMWQPYGPCEWPHLKNTLPNLFELIMKQREELQADGLLSPRKFPAQIVFTWSGLHREGGNDFLEARIFSSCHPEEYGGEPIECYILTGEKGAENIRTRVEKKYPHLQSRINDILIVIPSPPSSSSSSSQNVISTKDDVDNDYDVDISLVPTLLFQKLNMRIVNHDGGQRVLNAFCKAGKFYNPILHKLLIF